MKVKATLFFFLIISSFMMTAQRMLLEDFAPTTQLNWRIVNDGVMGGISRSQMEVSPDGLGQFSGVVSLENYGGFASTRARLIEVPKENYTKVLIKIKGDGKNYSFRIRTNANFDDVSYKQDFVTNGKDWEEIELPLADFIPTWRGRQLCNVPKIAAPQIRQVGFLISDKQEGAFTLLIDSISLAD